MQRVELTARGKLIRELTPARRTGTVPLASTPTAEFAALRLGEESARWWSSTALTGDILAWGRWPTPKASPTAGRTEWSMLSLIPRPRSTSAQRALPPGSTIKRWVRGAARTWRRPQEGLLSGGYALGNRFFRCLRPPGSVACAGYRQSCTHFLRWVTHRHDKIAPRAKRSPLAEFASFVSHTSARLPDATGRARIAEKN